MKVAFVTFYDPHDIRSWSGLGYYIADSLKRCGVEIDYLGPLTHRLTLWDRFRVQFYRRVLGKEFMVVLQPRWVRHYQRQVAAKLAASDADLVLCPHPQILGDFQCDRPIVYWGDTTFAGLLNFYADFSNLCDYTIRQGHAIDRAALNNAALAIFASDWAAQSARQHYGLAPEKIKVVPFGANITCTRTRADIEKLVAARPANECRLLFIGRVWERKGGDTAVAVARALNDAGLSTTLTLIGSQPAGPLPPFVRALGFVSKATEEGRRQFDALLAESHFLILPSRAECFGVVFCEASSFGVPSLATNIGGIPSAVRDGINGKTFPLEAAPAEWARHMRGLFNNFSDYQRLALSSFEEYQARLNWEVSGRRVKEFFEQVMQDGKRK
ncbi:MAG: glycosyltransferase family 4 protein [Verrucomicrobia bacterium]|nr:glycosyltransferase family 4 protein [Verrucomicrobiota bacterium]